MSALSDALLAANVERWSAREIARRGGDRVSHSQLGKYLKPTHPRPGEDVLQVFSDVFRIPMPKLRRLAGAPAGGAEPYEPPAEANRLDSRQRRVINELIRMLAETRAGDGDVDRDAAPIAGAVGPPAVGQPAVQAAMEPIYEAERKARAQAQEKESGSGRDLGDWSRRGKRPS